jgi:hypothetical protein
MAGNTSISRRACRRALLLRDLADDVANKGRAMRLKRAYLDPHEWLSPQTEARISFYSGQVVVMCAPCYDGRKLGYCAWLVAKRGDARLRPTHAPARNEGNGESA